MPLRVGAARRDLREPDRFEHALDERQRRRPPAGASRPSRARASPWCRRRPESGRRRPRPGPCRSPPRPARGPRGARSRIRRRAPGRPVRRRPARPRTCSAIVAPWNARTIRSTSSQLPSCASSSSSIRLAPAEKLRRVVADDQRGEVRGGFLHAGVQHLDRVAADRVHLRMELDARARRRRGRRGWRPRSCGRRRGWLSRRRAA